VRTSKHSPQLPASAVTTIQNTFARLRAEARAQIGPLTPWPDIEDIVTTHCWRCLDAGLAVVVETLPDAERWSDSEAAGVARQVRGLALAEVDQLAGEVAQCLERDLAELRKRAAAELDAHECLQAATPHDALFARVEHSLALWVEALSPAAQLQAEAAGRRAAARVKRWRLLPVEAALQVAALQYDELAEASIVDTTPQAFRAHTDLAIPQMVVACFQNLRQAGEAVRAELETGFLIHLVRIHEHRELYPPDAPGSRFATLLDVKAEEWKAICLEREAAAASAAVTGSELVEAVAPPAMPGAAEPTDGGGALDHETMTQPESISKDQRAELLSRAMKALQAQTEEELARKIGASRSSLNRWKNGAIGTGLGPERAREIEAKLRGAIEPV
jgi:hypothetical protein